MCVNIVWFYSRFTLLSAAAVCLGGLIGWVGLMIPIWHVHWLALITEGWYLQVRSLVADTWYLLMTFPVPLSMELPLALSQNKGALLYLSYHQTKGARVIICFWKLKMFWRLRQFGDICIKVSAAAQTMVMCFVCLVLMAVERPLCSAWY